MQSRYLYGMHDPGGEYLMAEAGKPGWIVFTESIGHNPHDQSGRDYHQWSSRGFGVIVRLNNGYGSEGTIPLPAFYDDFARRCANFVAASPGCNRWIIGNEPNHQQEWPGGQVIQAAQYADCFLRARHLIQQIQPNAEVLVAGIAPWNIQAGDWLHYFRDILTILNGRCDGIAMHTYTHGAEPSLITSEATMNPPFQNRRFHFRAYQDFLSQVPPTLAHLPVYITETNQNDSWVHANNGWVQAAYAEIHRWNQQPGTQKIHCLCLYRWPHFDRWGIQDNAGIIEDFRAAMSHGYQLVGESVDTDTSPPVPEWETGGTMAREWDARLTQRGIRLEEFAGQAGQARWQLVKAEYLEELQSQGKHHIFVDVLNEQGQRQVGIPVEFSFANGRDTRNSEAKPGELHAVDFPMFASGHSYNVRIADGVSDRVTGMGIGSVEQPHMGIHVSYRLVFRRGTAAEEDTTQPGQSVQPVQPVEPLSGDNWQRSIEWIFRWEGGFQNNPEDHGNWTGGRKGVGILKGTKFGISAASFPHLDIANLTRAQAAEIYFVHYWQPSGAHQMAWPLCLLVMDTAVLHGVGTARLWLNEVGPNPFAFAAKRLRVYTRLDNWKVFGAGWVNRTADLLEAMK